MEKWNFRIENHVSRHKSCSEIYLIRSLWSLGWHFATTAYQWYLGHSHALRQLAEPKLKWTFRKCPAKWPVKWARLGKFSLFQDYANAVNYSISILWFHNPLNLKKNVQIDIGFSDFTTPFFVRNTPSLTLFALASYAGRGLVTRNRSSDVGRIFFTN